MIKRSLDRGLFFRDDMLNFCFQKRMQLFFLHSCICCGFFVYLQRVTYLNTNNP